MRWLTSALVLTAMAGVAMATARPAWADGDSEREADAERLFREAQGLLEKGQYVEACPKFEKAYEKDGKLGTLMNLAFCHKSQGANWYAWLEFREAELKAAELGRKDRRDFALKQRMELEKGLPKVVLDNPQRIAITELRIEDRKVPDTERFTAEAGQRKFVFKAKGKKAATMLVTIVKGATPQHVTVPSMEDGSDEPPPPPPPPPENTAKVEPVKTPPPPTEDTGSTQRTASYVLMGAGGVGIIVGAVAGIITFNDRCSEIFHKRADDCVDGMPKPAASYVSNISFGVGGGLAAIGLVLWLTAPSAPRTTGIVVRPVLGPGYGGLTGSF